MKIHLHEIKDRDQEIGFDETTPWVTTTLNGIDEKDLWDRQKLRPAGLEHAQPVRPTQVLLNLRKVDDVVVLSGSVKTHVALLCSRCGKPFNSDVDTHFSALFSRDPEIAGLAYLDKNDNPHNQNLGRSRSTRPQPVLGKEANDDLEVTFLQGDELDLSEVLAEQIRLKLPIQPLCKESCKGVCQTCGTDLNIGRCACAKIADPAKTTKLNLINLQKKTEDRA